MASTSLRSRLKSAADALRGVSTYEPPSGVGAELDDETVEQIRRAVGGQLQPIPTTRIRWYLADLETAQHAADGGSLVNAARLWNAMRRDGTLAGLLNTRTDGLVRLPKRFYGDPKIASEMQSDDGPRSTFDELAPPSELALLDADGLGLGVGISELVPVDGRDFPVMVRLDPEFLQYRWAENRWYFASIAGLLPITPGNGRWVLHMPGGRIAPWRYGMWPALGKNFIEKDHAIMHRANFSAKLANPARVATAPMGATEPQRKGMIAMLMSWAVNSVFELPVGWDVKLIESKGEGWKVFQDQIDTSNREYMVLIAGQEVTTTGGTGFSNQQMPEMIRQDLIAGDAEKLSYTVNTQVLPVYSYLKNGDAGLARPTWMQWATGRAKDMKDEGATLQTVGQGIEKLVATLAAAGSDRELDIGQIAERFGIPLRDRAKREDKPSLQLAPTDIARVVRVNEARSGVGLPPLTLPDGSPDPDGLLTVSEFQAKHEGASGGGSVDPDALAGGPTPEGAARAQAITGRRAA